MGGKDVQIYPMENNRRLAQQSFSIQLKEVQAFKDQEYLLQKSKECTMEDSSNVNEDDKKKLTTKNNNKRKKDNVNNYSAEANDQDNQRGTAEKPKTTTTTTTTTTTAAPIKIIRAIRSTPISKV